MRRTAALIAGGGPAGSAAAIALAAAGTRALLLERERETRDPLCGGFTSWRTLATLERLGVDPAALGGHPITRVRVFAGTRRLDARLPAAGIGLSRHALDRALLAAAARAGAGIERGVAIRAATGDGLRLADGGMLAADALFLATSKHDLRGLPRPQVAADPAVGLRVRLAPTAALAVTLTGTIELHAFGGGYAGLLLQEDGSANLCLAVTGSRLRAAGTPARLLAELGKEAPRLGERLGAGGAWGAIDAVAGVPYGLRATAGEQGLFRLGDQAAVIPSLAGEGIGIALASGIAAARAYSAGGAAASVRFQRALARRTLLPVALASGLKAVVEQPRLAGLLLALAPPAVLRPLARLTRVDGRLIGPGGPPIFAP